LTDFFRPPPPPDEPVPEPSQPAWLGPPENELGVAVGLRLVLARTERVAVAVTDVTAYSSGLHFSLDVRLREADELLDPFGFRSRQRPGRAGAELPPELLRFGFELADGRRATNVAGFPGFEAPPDEPVLIQRGGGGGGRSWSFGYWLWPLPPGPTLTVVVEWPKEGIELTRHEVATDPLLRAAAQSEALWPEGSGPRSGGGMTSQSTVSRALPPKPK
jgi:hypothetical protein